MQAAGAKGLAVKEEAFIRILPALEPDALHKLSAAKATVIFTSAHAVQIVFSAINTQPPWQVFCLSGATKAAVARFMDARAIQDTAMDGATLAEKILARKDIKECLFFCGRKRMNSLPRMLSEKNISLKEITVYDTLLTPKEIKDRYDGILFFSPTAVASFFAVNDLPSHTVLFSVGHTTTQALKKYSGNMIITGKYPAAGHLIELAASFDFDAGRPS